MASDQKCVSGEGAPAAAKYDSFEKIFAQLMYMKMPGTMSGRILVSRAWLNMAMSRDVTTTNAMTVGMRRQMRRTQ